LFIGDFGLCRKLHSEETQTGSLTIGAGTPIYMAPEVQAGKDYSFQADIYSLGLIIWEVVQLIPQKDKVSIFQALTIDREANVVKPHVSLPGIKELIINLTKRKVEERSKTMNDVMEAWKVNSNP
jgi:serine/threonine protein kinase